MATARKYILFFIYVFLHSTAAVELSDFLLFGSGYTGSANEQTTNVQYTFDSATNVDAYVDIDIPNDPNIPQFAIFGVNLGKKAFVNFNGHITFLKSNNDFRPVPLNSLNEDIFAVFFSDNDLRRPNGLLHRRFTRDPTDLALTQQWIRNQGFFSFTPAYCLVSTWENVKYYTRMKDERDDPIKQYENTYQMILCTDGFEAHPIYQYNKLEWLRKDDQAANMPTGGWYIRNAATPDKYFELPGSGTPHFNTSLLQGTNTKEPYRVLGRWMREPLVSCSGRPDGVYDFNCTTYYRCCTGRVEKMVTCPLYHVYHPITKHCVEESLYSCREGAPVSFCYGKQDGKYANEASQNLTDFFLCKNQLTRLLNCPSGITFSVTNPHPRCPAE